MSGQSGAGVALLVGRVDRDVGRRVVGGVRKRVDAAFGRTGVNETAIVVLGAVPNGLREGVAPACCWTVHAFWMRGIDAAPETETLVLGGDRRCLWTHPHPVEAVRLHVLGAARQSAPYCCLVWCRVLIALVGGESGIGASAASAPAGHRANHAANADDQRCGRGEMREPHRLIVTRAVRQYGRSFFKKATPADIRRLAGVDKPAASSAPAAASSATNVARWTHVTLAPGVVLLVRDDASDAATKIAGVFEAAFGAAK
jgi:hypothetical protein